MRRVRLVTARWRRGRVIVVLLLFCGSSSTSLVLFFCLGSGHLLGLVDWRGAKHATSQRTTRAQPSERCAPACRFLFGCFLLIIGGRCRCWCRCRGGRCSTGRGSRGVCVRLFWYGCGWVVLVGLFRLGRGVRLGGRTFPHRRRRLAKLDPTKLGHAFSNAGAVRLFLVIPVGLLLLLGLWDWRQDARD